MSPLLINYPTLEPECNDTEARSLKKLNELSNQELAALKVLAQPGGNQIAPVKYLFGNAYQIPANTDLLDIGCYNPNDGDVWVYILISPGGPIPGAAPTFMFRVYGHNDSYYEAYASRQTVPAGQRWDIAVSSAETALTWSAPVYLAIRHS